MSEWAPTVDPPAAVAVFPRCVRCRWPDVCSRDGMCWEQVREDEEAERQSKADRRREQRREAAGLPALRVVRP